MEATIDKYIGTRYGVFGDPDQRETKGRLPGRFIFLALEMQERMVK